MKISGFSTWIMEPSGMKIFAAGGSMERKGLVAPVADSLLTQETQDSMVPGKLHRKLYWFAESAMTMETVKPTSVLPLVSGPESMTATSTGD